MTIYRNRPLIAVTVIFLTVFTDSPAVARDYIRIVGSSSVFPFAASVAERFGRKSSYSTPIVEATGTGGGMKLFCAGIGLQYPDVSNASRRIKQSEIKLCRKNNIANIVEIKIGFDGVVIANSRSAGEIDIKLAHLFLALAREVPQGNQLVPNPYKRWRDIHSSLPDQKIEVLGPPPTSGTRDSFVEIAMERGARFFPILDSMARDNKQDFKPIAHALREDRHFIEMGENDNLIVQKLIANPHALGIFSFSFLEVNRDRIQAVALNSYKPHFETVASGDYPLVRSLYLYVKKAHANQIPGLQAFINAFMSDQAIGQEGYLIEKGLIPLPQKELLAQRAIARDLKPLSKL